MKFAVDMTPACVDDIIQPDGSFEPLNNTQRRNRFDSMVQALRTMRWELLGPDHLYNQGTPHEEQPIHSDVYRRSVG